MPRPINFVPKYCRHRSSGQAVVTITGTDHYLGPWNSKASRIEYDRLVGEWIANGRAVHQSERSSLTVSEVVAAYWKFAQGFYRKDGQPTGAIPGIKIALRLLRQLYGHTPANNFGPLALAAVRQRLIEAGNSRTYINAPGAIPPGVQVGCIARVNPGVGPSIPGDLARTAKRSHRSEATGTDWSRR